LVNKLLILNYGPLLSSTLCTTYRKGLLTFASLPVRWEYSVPARKDNETRRQFSRKAKWALDT